MGRNGVERKINRKKCDMSVLRNSKVAVVISRG